MSAPAPLAPADIQSIGSELAIRWNDEQESYLPLEFLRRHCPCAACGGEPDVMGNVARPKVSYGPRSFLLRTWRQIGGYAVQPIWEDGHDSGLYTYRYLRALEPTPPT